MVHPMQPVIIDEIGLKRFRSNKILVWLHSCGRIDLNELMLMPFTNEDRVQLAQLIGYPVEGFKNLCYVSDEDKKRADEAPVVGEEKRWS